MVTTLKKSYSLTDLTAGDDEADEGRGGVPSTPKITDVTDGDPGPEGSSLRDRTYSEGRQKHPRASPMRQADDTLARRRRQSPRKDET